MQNFLKLQGNDFVRLLGLKLVRNDLTIYTLKRSSKSIGSLLLVRLFNSLSKHSDDSELANFEGNFYEKES